MNDVLQTIFICSLIPLSSLVTLGAFMIYDKLNRI